MDLTAGEGPRGPVIIDELQFLRARLQELEEQRRDSQCIEAALARSQELLRIVVETTGLGLWELDLVTRRVSSTPECRAILGLPADQEYTHEDWIAALHPDDRARVVAAFEALVPSHSRLYQETYRVVLPDQSIRWVQATGQIVYDEAQATRQALRAVGTVLDITERRAVEEKLHAQACELERSNEELQQFAYTASHDLQEPLRTVVSYSQLLARRYTGSFGQEGDEFITLVVEAANRMSKLVSSLLRYAQVGQAGELRRTPVNCEEVFTAVLRTMSFVIGDTEAKITHDQLPIVSGDESQLSQLFQNLISNSIKYRSNEPPRIHVSVQEADGFWRFCVRDNGLGFSQKYANKVFGVFKRLHGTKYSGTGIGLAICKRIVEHHGGRIWAESEIDRGSSFYFTLPL